MPGGRRRSVLIRRVVQALSLLLFVSAVWMTGHPLARFINPAVYFHADPLAMTVTAVAERVLLPGLAVSLAVLLLTLAAGRVFCGWFCPLGAALDAVAVLKRLVTRRRPREGEQGRARYAKYLLLSVISLFALGGVQLAWIFDPFAVFVRALSFNIQPFVTRSIDSAFAAALERTGFPGWLESIYYSLKGNLLVSSGAVFPHSGLVLVIFIAILAAVFAKRRLWCRMFCPLGAFLALAARFAPLRRFAGACRPGCSLCRDACRMNAIRSDNTTVRSECILCMDCVAGCPQGASAFAFRRPVPAVASSGEAAPGGISRAQFIAALGGSLLALSGASRKAFSAPNPAARPVIRPPASLPEREFVQRCVRCGNCMKACLTNGLQPVLLESGWEGIWTPRLDTRIGYCEYLCTECGRVCPTGAIGKLSEEEKVRARLGTAVIDRSRCLPWAKGEECLVCEEHCPVPGKAIKIDEARRNAGGRPVLLPRVDADMCVGCSICEHKCPVTGEKAIVIRPG